MKKMFSEEIIRHKMAMDGSFEPLEIEAFFGNQAALASMSSPLNSSSENTNSQLPESSTSAATTTSSVSISNPQNNMSNLGNPDGGASASTDNSNNSFVQRMETFTKKHNNSFSSLEDIVKLLTDEGFSSADISSIEKTMLTTKK